LLVQAVWRGRTARGRFDTLRRAQAAVDLQAAWRMYAARKAFKASVDAAVTMQSAFRCTVSVWSHHLHA
jgi:hypothetical protein